MVGSGRARRTGDRKPFYPMAYDSREAAVERFCSKYRIAKELACTGRQDRRFITASLAGVPATRKHSLDPLLKESKSLVIVNDPRQVIRSDGAAAMASPTSVSRPAPWAGATRPSRPGSRAWPRAR